MGKTLGSLPGSERVMGSATVSGYQVQAVFNLMFGKLCNKILVGNKVENKELLVEPHFSLCHSFGITNSKMASLGFAIPPPHPLFFPRTFFSFFESF